MANTNKVSMLNNRVYGEKYRNPMYNYLMDVFGLKDKRSKLDGPNSDRIKNLTDEDLEAYIALPKNQRAAAMTELRNKYGVA